MLPTIPIISLTCRRNWLASFSLPKWRGVSFASVPIRQCRRVPGPRADWHRYNRPGCAPETPYRPTWPIVRCLLNYHLFGFAVVLYYIWRGYGYINFARPAGKHGQFCWLSTNWHSTHNFLWRCKFNRVQVRQKKEAQAKTKSGDGFRNLSNSSSYAKAAYRGKETVSAPQAGNERHPASKHCSYATRHRPWAAQKTLLRLHKERRWGRSRAEVWRSRIQQRVVEVLRQGTQNVTF